MDLATLFYNLREEVSCSVCSDLFTDPKHLSCLHSFCLKCLKRWYETRGGGDAIKCPKCQTLSKVPASGDLKDLPTSFYLNGLIDVLAIKECKKTQVTCRNCEKKSSEASYCFQCCIFYCEECLIGHNIMRDKKEHRILAVKEFQDKDYEDVLKRPVFCSRQGHQKKKLKLFCKECDTAVCQTCVMLDHNGHKLTLIEEEAESRRLEIKTVIQTQRQNLDKKIKEVIQLDEDCAKVIQQSENSKKDVQRFADGLIKLIQAKLQTTITTVKNQTEKSLERLRAKRSNIQHQINVIESSLEEADRLLRRSTAAEIVQRKKSQTIFQGVDQMEPIVHDLSSLQAFVFVENQKMVDIINVEEIGFLEEPYQTQASESLAEGEGLKEGTVGRKAQFNLITRNAKRKQGYDERDRVTVEIMDEQERECVTEVRIDDNKDGMYNISYYPRVQGTMKLLVKVNWEHIHESPFTVTERPFHAKPVFSFGKQGPGNGKFHRPYGVAVNDRDEIVVADNWNHCAQVFDSNGNFLRSFCRRGENPGEFDYPNGIAIDKDRNIFISEWGNHRVQIFSWEGRYLGSFGGLGSLDSQLKCPRGLSLDSTGNIIVADTGNNKQIKIFTPDGTFVVKIGGQDCFTVPFHCVQCDELLIVSDSAQSCIKVFNKEGQFQYKFGKKGEGDGEFIHPHLLPVTQSKHLLVCDLGNHRIQVFELTGKFVGKFGTKGSELGEFSWPFSVAVLSNDHIVVSDLNNHRIQIFE